jgi:hypothetical protein
MKKLITGHSKRTCGRCGSPDIKKDVISDKVVWKCKCGEYWAADSESSPPQFVRGKKIYHKSKPRKVRTKQDIH